MSDARRVYAAIPIYLDPSASPAELPDSVQYMALMEVQLPAPATVSEAFRCQRVDAVLDHHWGISLETLSDYEPPSDPLRSAHLLPQLQPVLDQLARAGIEPDDLALVLSWVIDTPVLVRAA